MQFLICHGIQQRSIQEAVCTNCRHQQYQMKVLILLFAAGIYLAGNRKLMGAQQQQTGDFIHQTKLIVIEQSLFCLLHKFGRARTQGPFCALGGVNRRLKVRHHHPGTNGELFGYAKLCVGDRIFEGPQNIHQVGRHAGTCTAKQAAKQIKAHMLSLRKRIQILDQCFHKHAIMYVQEAVPDTVEHRCTNVGMTIKTFFQCGRQLHIGIQRIHQQ